MKNEQPPSLTTKEAEKLRALGRLPDDAMIVVSLEDIGFKWLSSEPQPDPLPLKVHDALNSSLESIKRLLVECCSDPISVSAYGMTPEELAKNPNVIKQLCNQHGAGERFDKLKKSKEPFASVRRRTLVWNQFRIRMKVSPHMPGFVWFSDENTAALLSELLGQDVSTVDVENDRRSLLIKKLPAKYLFPSKIIRSLIAARRRAREERS
jgi:hypothetical protein